MALDKKSGRKRKEDSEDLSKLTRQQLRDLEAREKTTGQKVLDSIIVVLPVVCGNDCHFGIYVDSKWKSESGYLYISWTSDYSDCGLYRLHDGRRHQ